MPDSDSSGLEPSATTDASPDTNAGTAGGSDGGPSRRVFLGAAAALASLPATGTPARAAPTEGVEPPAAETCEPGADPVVATSGMLEVRAGQLDSTQTNVTVTGHPEGVTLQLATDVGALQVLLLPEDIVPLCRRLRAARDQTQSANVEDARTWITECRGGTPDEER